MNEKKMGDEPDPQGHPGRGMTVFEQAARVFPGWTDPDTGLRVLRLKTRGEDPQGPIWRTPYHQSPCFLDRGRKVLLHGAGSGGKGQGLVDLATGRVDEPLPVQASLGEVHDGTRMATVFFRSENERPRVAIWDLRRPCEVAGYAADDGWTIGSINLLSDGIRAIVWVFRGKAYTEPVHSRHLLLTPGEPVQCVLDAPGFFCSHAMTCPTDPGLYAYDRWPSPARPIEQAIHIRALDGSFEEPLKLLPGTLRSADMWGCRDHYLWTPDGRWIVSYLFPHPLPKQETFNHLAFEWWLSATDWRTGEDRCAQYPPGRWGGHMGVSPDSRQILCAGGPGFDRLFLVDIEGLRNGWNERVLCTYPRTVSKGVNSDPFAMPFALPDQSGILFNAGWPGPEHGVYLVEWPSAR